MNQFLEKQNIALVHDWITNVAGAERVLWEISSLFPDAPIYTAVFDKNRAKKFSTKDIKTSILQNIPFSKTKRELLIPFTPFAFEQFDLSKYDIVVSSTTMAAKGVITKPNVKHVCYCHTPPRYLWEPDLDPRANAGKFSFLRKITAHKMRIWDRLAADRVDLFVANSNYTAKRIKKYYGRDAKVVYPAVDTQRFEVANPNEVKDYFLYVSRLVNYKRCDLIIEAFNKLKLPLKIIGNGPEKNRLKDMAKNNIEFLGFLSDEEVATYYKEAKAFVFAAEEDFGIVPVEAMAAGRPVIAYGAGGVLETIVENKTGLFFKEQTAESLIEAVKNFNVNDFDPHYIKSHAEKFSVETFRKRFLNILNDLAE